MELARLASDLKADEVVVLDVRGMSSLSDYLLICTGTSDRQMRSVCDKMREYGARVGERPLGVSGYDTDSWILVDFVDVVVHVFAAAYRSYYDLELLWGDAPRIAWQRSESA